MTDIVLRNSFTILMNVDKSPYGILTNENEMGSFKPLLEDEKQYLYCDYCSVEIGLDLEFLYRVVWDIENRIYMVAVYKRKKDEIKLITHIPSDDINMRFMFPKEAEKLLTIDDKKDLETILDTDDVKEPSIWNDK